MNRNRVDRRKQIVPRRGYRGPYPDVHREAVEAAKKSRAREKASVVIQKHIRSHQRKPVVYIKGRDLNNPLAKVTTDRGWYYPKQTYARYEYLRDFLRNQPGDGGEGLYIEASPLWTTKRARSFQKVYLPPEINKEIVRRSHGWGDIHEAAMESDNKPIAGLGLPPEWVPDATVKKKQVKEAIDRRRRKLRDIEGGDIVIRDALFRDLPDRGRRFKKTPKPKPAPTPFYYF